MNAIKNLAALVYFLNRAEATPVSVNCVDVVFRDDSACDGTTALPCEAKIVGVEVGTVVELAYDQQITDGPCNPNGANGECEDYPHTIYVRVTGEPTGTANVELTQYGMMALCKEPCLDAASSGVFTGICQSPGALPADGCQYPADASTVCASNVLLLGDTIATDVSTDQGRCEPIGAAPGTKACSIDDPCEVKVLGGVVGDILQITYDQPISDAAENNYGAYCKGLGDDACEAYSRIIWAEVVAGEPLMTEVELDRNGMEQICKGACLDGASGTGPFTGVCQANPVVPDDTECNDAAAMADEICGVNLVGTFQYEVVTESTLAPQSSTAPSEGEDNSPTTAEDSTVAPQTTTATTSGAKGAIVGLTLIGLMMTA